MLPAGVNSPVRRLTRSMADLQIPTAAPSEAGTGTCGGVSFQARGSGIWPDEHHQKFHEHGTFFAIWLLVLFVGMEILTKARNVIEPILWAFFLMMGLVPLTDVVEYNILRFCCRCNKTPAKKTKSSEDTGETSRSDDDDDESESEPTQERERQRQASSTSVGHRVGSPQRGEWQHVRMQVDSEEEGGVDHLDPFGVSGEAHPPEATPNCQEGGWVRTLSVVIVILLTLSFGVLFFTMVYQSAVHMQDSWPHYERGAQTLSKRIQTQLDQLPEKMVEEYTQKALTTMESAVFELINTIVESTSHAFVEIIWILLYMVFWLCQPVHIGKDVSAVFRRYIFLKGIASGGYAFCIWILLHFLGVDLAIVFGLITFVLNFIPEVGPFIAMMLPLPVVLFDDRISSPIYFMAIALAGQLALKVVWGNIVEIKLIESQQEMRMHPVVILFFVAFFQYIWGATGMLLSVPIVAALKATLHKVPPAYRNPILVFLEGDQSAPAKWKRWRETLRQEMSPPLD
mmetsp:Transcript_36514/g.77678  ORF Transcript_36514/g.77678 Transcript_36514/m.77678 type:complete len:513 (-) Transcript_36514:29-1567(-)